MRPEAVATNINHVQDNTILKFKEDFESEMHESESCNDDDEDYQPDIEVDSDEDEELKKNSIKRVRRSKFRKQRVVGLEMNESDMLERNESDGLSNASNDYLG